MSLSLNICSAVIFHEQQMKCWLSNPNIFSWIIHWHVRLSIFKLISPFFFTPELWPAFSVSTNGGVISPVTKLGIKLFLSLFSHLSYLYSWQILYLFYKTNLILLLPLNVFFNGSLIAFWIKIRLVSST